MKNLYLIGSLFGALAASQAWADPELIHIMRDGCAVTRVVDHEARPGCPADAACRNKGERVKWLVTPYAPFSIGFPGPSPLDDSRCLTGQGTCTISMNASGEYNYDVNLNIEGCEPIDPKIIVN